MTVKGSQEADCAVPSKSSSGFIKEGHCLAAGRELRLQATSTGNSQEDKIGIPPKIGKGQSTVYIIIYTLTPHYEYTCYEGQAIKGVTLTW